MRALNLRKCGKELTLGYLVNIAAIIGSTACFADASHQTFTLNINGLISGQGNVMGVFYQSEEDYKSRSNGFSHLRIPVTSDSVDVILTDLPNSMIIFTGYQDVNGNNKLDTNLIGIPNEPYGFSNNARGQYGPPKYSQMAFLPTTNKSMTIDFLSN
ncbi:DUF2141 domain-containing protein [Marinomonas sp. 2405UD68-3]|uniref:DUF2141 domain-containing protein n=1 Tax=Marinomonas sp. 2405UD68-3 TaxID=3391835 RepID=UPI0039C9E5F0